MNKSDIATKVMNEIESEQVTMRPRWHFFAVSALSGLGIITLSGLAVYLVNVITLTIRIQAIDRPMYGARQRLSDLLASFPWWMVAVTALALAVLIWLLRRQRRFYRMRLGWMIALVLAVGLTLGLLISLSPLNQPHNGQGQNAPRSQQIHR